LKRSLHLNVTATLHITYPSSHCHPSSNLTHLSAIKRKLHLAKLAALRNRKHRLNNPTILNNRATLVTPNPLPLQRAEMSISQASRLYPASEISAGISKELGKHFDTYNPLHSSAARRSSPTQCSCAVRSSSRRNLLDSSPLGSLLTAASNLALRTTKPTRGHPTLPVGPSSYTPISQTQPTATASIAYK
jgi:hypothetical protein